MGPRKTRLDLAKWIGRKQGKLEVLSVKHKVESGYLLNCRCDCGKETLRHTSSFKKRAVNSGCEDCNLALCIKANRIRMPNEDAAFNHLYRSYQKNAKNKKIEFQLSEKEFREITQKDCIYCGETPSNKTVRRNREYRYNGIDRVNNLKGYVIENCAPCCRECNFAKQGSSLEQFLEMCHKVAEKWPRVATA